MALASQSPRISVLHPGARLSYTLATIQEDFAVNRGSGVLVACITERDTIWLLPLAADLPSLPQGVHGHPTRKGERVGRARTHR